MLLWFRVSRYGEIRVWHLVFLSESIMRTCLGYFLCMVSYFIWELSQVPGKSEYFFLSLYVGWWLVQRLNEDGIYNKEMKGMVKWTRKWMWVGDECQAGLERWRSLRNKRGREVKLWSVSHKTFIHQSYNKCYTCFYL